jgi:hypothetical protein
LIKLQGERAMTVRELIEKLKTVDSDMEIFIEGRDSTGEYYDADEMTEKHIVICDRWIIIDAG